MIRKFISILALGAVLISAPAFAQDEVSVHVSYADLNLSSPAGARVFHQRIKDALVQICGTIDPHDPIYFGARIQGCLDSTGATAERLERQAIAAAASRTPLLASTQGMKPIP